MTIFGAPWESLELHDVRAFFAEAENEPLLWEAKGDDVRPEHVRRAVCAFGNGYETSYLVLGAEETEDGWGLSGIAVRDEPHRWISDVVAEHVSPLPLFDVKAWPVGVKRVVVVRVEPSASPPCMYNGTVYERLPGRTQPVRDSLRLLALVNAGRTAHERARTAVMGLKGTAHGHGLLNTPLVLETRVSPVGFAQDLRRRVHQQGFAANAHAAVVHQLLPAPNDGTPLSAPEVETLHGNAGVELVAVRRSLLGNDRHAVIACTPDGVVTIRTLQVGQVGRGLNAVREALEQHLLAADRMSHQIEARGGVYVAVDGVLTFDGPKLDTKRAFAFEGPVDDLCAPGLTELLFRQIRRAAGEVVYEPGGGGVR